MKDQKYSLICKAILKYGHSNFTLVIIEYCEPENAISREQYYIDHLKPDYNLLKIAGSRLGSIQSEETKAKIKEANLGRKHLEETILKMSEAKKGKNHPFFFAFPDPDPHPEGMGRGKGMQ